MDGESHASRLPPPPIHNRRRWQARALPGCGGVPYALPGEGLVHSGHDPTSVLSHHGPFWVSEIDTGGEFTPPQAALSAPLVRRMGSAVSAPAVFQPATRLSE